jgi:3-hydroxyacyl-[acyl-carrier-protein] dehydratase
MLTPPELIQEVTGDGFRERTLKIADALGCLEGHFPGFPVVPAVMQLQWVMEAAVEMVGQRLALQRIEALKFKDILRPGQVFRVTLKLSPAGNSIDFRLWGDARLFSTGRFFFGPNEGQRA